MRTATVLAIILLLPATAGCFESRQRLPIVVDGDLEDLRLFGAPVLASGAPPLEGAPVPDSMGVVEVRLRLPDAYPVEMTGVTVRAEADNGTWTGHVVRLRVDPGVLVPSAGDLPVELSNGSTVRVHFRLHDEAGVPWIEPGTRVQVHVDTWWRYESGDRFDADKVRVRTNGTVEAPAATWVGPNATSASVAGTGADARLRVAVDDLPEGPAVAFAVGSDGRTLRTTVRADDAGHALNGTLGTLPPTPGYAVVVVPWPTAANATLPDYVAVGRLDAGDGA